MQSASNDIESHGGESPNENTDSLTLFGLRSTLSSPINEGSSPANGSIDSRITQSICNSSTAGFATNSDDSSESKIKLMKISKKTLPGENCKICDEVASGVHFGIFSCEGCKRFFQRASVGAIKKLVCKRGTKNCDVQGAFRTKCKFCRFKRCVQMGMSSNVIQLGRDARKRARQLPQPNPDENLSEMLTNFWSNRDEGSACRIPKKSTSAKQRGVRSNSLCRDAYRPRDVSFSDGSSDPSPNVSETSVVHQSVLMGPISSEISQTSTLLFIYLDYLTNLYKQTKQQVQTQFLTSSTTLPNLLTICADRAIAFVHQLPGIYLQKILSNESLCNHFLNISSRVIENLCVHALASLPNGSAITLNIRSPALRPLVDVYLNSDMYKNLRNDIEMRKIDKVGEAIVFTLETLDQLALLDDDEIRSTVAQLKIQTTLLFSHYTSNATYLCSRFY